MKRIVFECIGGDSDGMLLDSHSDDPVVSKETVDLYHLTDKGELGRGYFGSTPNKMLQLLRGEVGPQEVRGKPGKKHWYKITDRQEDDDTVRLRFEYSVYDPEERG